MKQIRLSLIGFGVVGQGLAQLLLAKQAFLQREYGAEVSVVSIANARHGFIYREQGLDLAAVLELARQRRPLTELPDIQHWAVPLDGLKATGTAGDVLAEATGTNLRDAEPGMSHIRAALTQKMHVITANKGPVALAGPALLALAQEQGVQLRLEATVMAGTPVISTICEGLAGAQVRSLRGILNGTTNYILSAMATGRAYADVLAEAQAQGYAEADPTADVEGYDAVAKTLILAALVFGAPLKPEQVFRQGITAITREEVQQASNEEKRIKLIASLQVEGQPDHQVLKARVEPVALSLHDPLARVDGVLNAISVQTDTLSEVTVIGPGAGSKETGQGLLADLIAIIRSLRD